MGYAITILWNDRAKYVPAMIAVSVRLLVALQFGLLAGTLSFTSIPIDRSRADLWIAVQDVPSLDLGMPIPESWLGRLAGEPGVTRAEPYLYGFAACDKRTGGTVVCCVIGTRMGPSAIGPVVGLTEEAKRRLAEPDTVVIDRSELERFGLTTGVGETIEVSKRKVRIVALIDDYKSIGGPFVFCSQSTARRLLPSLTTRPDAVTYWLVETEAGAEPQPIAERLRRRYGDMEIFTRDEFSRATQTHWLTRSKAGIAMGFTAFLSLLVSLVVTSQTLYSATMASLKEFATLRLGIGRGRIGMLVMQQAFWVGVVGILMSAPAIFGMARLVGYVGAKVVLYDWLLAGTAALTMITAMQSGMWALRSLRHVEPVTLLR